MRLLIASAVLSLVWSPLWAASLSDEVVYLLENHPRLNAARNNVSAADEGVKRAFGEYLPSLDLFTDWGYEHTDSPGLRSTTSRNGSSLHTPRESLSLTLTENIFTGFRREASNKTARLNREIAAITLEGTRQEILFEAVSAYLNVLRHSALIGFAVGNAQNIQRQLNLEDERVQRGAGITVDVLQSKSRLQIAKERRVAFEGNIRNAVARYAQVFGVQPELASMTTPEAPLGMLPPTLEEAERIVLLENPIVANSSRVIDLSQERKRSAQSPYYPEIDLVGQYNYEQDVQGVIGSRRDYVVKIEARWNLFTGFSTRADVADATFRNMAAVESHSFVNRKVIEDVRLSWDQFDTVRARVTLLENAVNIATEVYVARNKRRLAGQETLLDLLDAENEVFIAQISAADAAFDSRIAVYRMLFSIGRMTPEAILK
jgi:adhesin transport system outer membrane protein